MHRPRLRLTGHDHAVHVHVSSDRPAPHRHTRRHRDRRCRGVVGLRFEVGSRPRGGVHAQLIDRRRIRLTCDCDLVAARPQIEPGHGRAGSAQPRSQALTRARALELGHASLVAHARDAQPTVRTVAPDQLEVHEVLRLCRVERQRELVDIVAARESTRKECAERGGDGIGRIVVRLCIAPGDIADRRAHDVRSRTGRRSSLDVEQVRARWQPQVIEVCLPGRVEPDRADRTPPVPREQVQILDRAQPALQDHVPTVGGRISVELPCQIVRGPADIAAHDEGITYGRGVRGIVVRLRVRARWEGIAEGQLDVIVERRERTATHRAGPADAKDVPSGWDRSGPAPTPSHAPGRPGP